MGRKVSEDKKAEKTKSPDVAGLVKQRVGDRRSADQASQTGI
jgi:hypothetical protein